MTTRAQVPRPAPVPGRTRVSDRRAIEDKLAANDVRERDVLGALLVGNGESDDILAELRADDFFRPEHQVIFAAIREVRDAGDLPDLVNVHEKLERSQQIEKAGGAGYLASLGDGVPRIDRSVVSHARHIRIDAIRRALAYVGNDVLELAQSQAVDVAEVLDQAEAKISRLRANLPGSTEPRDWQKVFHGWEDFENAPALTFSIGGFLQNDGATMIGGLSGHGKTMILCSIAKALLAGRGAKLWDLFPVEQSAVRVVYLVPECSIGPFKHRLKLFHIYDALKPEDGRFLVRTLSAGPTPCLSDPRILFAARGAHVILDTASRFSEGDENSASDNARGLASDIFGLLAAGARSVIAAHHSPKSFAGADVMKLENVLRGTGDVGAMLSTAWAVKQIDAESNLLHVENVKPRDFQPCKPFQIVGRPYIDQEGDFRVHKRPGECGSLQDEQTPERDRGGAPAQAREARAANIELLRRFLEEDPKATSDALAKRFAELGITLSPVTVRKYRAKVDQ